jgi:DNA-binding NarL/FixJ family response regulator
MAPAPLSTAPRRILIVDDHPIVRLGVRQLINAEPDLSVCADVETAEAAIDFISRERPDLAIVDLSLGGRSGLELLRELHANYPDLAVVVLSLHDEALFAERTLRTGARAYVMKSEAPDALVTTIRQVLAGKIVVGQNVSQHVLERLGGDSPRRNERLAGLTDREIEVFEMVGRGSSTAQIAERLGLSIKTIETYRSNIKAKLHLRDATEFVRYATTWVEHV